ncbi:amino acid permease [Paenibacillus filicis]|uniref:Amino acid permease n=1 Tax=Paenibacillus gyeongsangnamensis TaxID=3388067 RepID=A0ABT4QEG4_9BACL|nr:amino acid permease [Paenibacillus filicis]MCZ8515065.1 amino acid permease [Paenibacillus filicis]
MPTSKTNSKSQPLGKITALLLTTGMMVGTGIFTTLGAATAEARSGILIAMLIGGIIALLTGISAAQVGAKYPEEGGAFIWMRIFGYPTISFAAGISYLIKGIVGLGIAALGFATYSAQIFPGLPIPITASIALLAVAGVNFFGITPTTKVVIGIFFINLVLLGLYVGLAMPSVKVQNLTPVLGTGITGILGGAATFFWAWDGFQRTAIMADKVKNPRKTLPFAIIGGISLAAIIFVILAETTLGVLGANAMGKSDTPLLLGAKITGWGIWTILLSAWILAFSDQLSDLMSTSKVGHAMGAEHELPHWFGTVHKRFKSPQYVILLLTIVALALINLVPLRRLIPVASVSTLIWYVATNLSAINLSKEKRFTRPIVSWLGIAACIALFFSLPRWSVVGAIGFLLLLIGIRWLFKRVTQKAAVDTGGNWTVSGLTLAQGDIISVTAQYAGDTASTEVTTIVASAPIQTEEPVISGTITAADITVSGKAPSGASVVLSINGVAQTAVTATGGNWTVFGLTLAQGDFISVTAQSAGETMSTAATKIVAPAPQTVVPVTISGTVTEVDKTVSGKAPSGASVMLSVNGKAEPAVVATGGNWTVPGLTLAQGDSISVTAQSADETVHTAAITTVAPAPLKTAEPVISGVVTAADTTVSGTAPYGAKVALSINGKARPAVLASSGKPLRTIASTTAAAPLQTVQPVISGIVTASDTTVTGTAPSGASVVLSVNGVSHPAVVVAGGNWMVAGLTLAQGDSISVTSQSDGQIVSTAASTKVAAPIQTAEPVISRLVVAADTAVSGTAPSGANIVLSVNGIPRPAVVATGGNWMVSGLTLAKGDSISVTAQAVGQTISAAATTTVAANWIMPGSSLEQLPVIPPSDGPMVSTAASVVAAELLQTAQPVISGIIMAADTTVSGTAPFGASIVLSVNGIPRPAIEATGGNWMVSGLTLAIGDSISVTAQAVGQTASAAALTTVAASWMMPSPNLEQFPIIPQPGGQTGSTAETTIESQQI